MEIADRKEEAADAPVVEIITVAANRTAAIMVDAGKNQQFGQIKVAIESNWLAVKAASLFAHGMFSTCQTSHPESVRIPS
jgi:hypothetical protein